MVVYGSDAERCETVFKALANEQRLTIMHLLYTIDGKVTVTEFASVFDDSTSNASRQLKVLREAGLVEKKREGRNTFYVPTSHSDAFSRLIREAIEAIPSEGMASEVDRCRLVASKRGCE